MPRLLSNFNFQRTEITPFLLKKHNFLSFAETLAYYSLNANSKCQQLILALQKIPTPHASASSQSRKRLPGKAFLKPMAKGLPSQTRPPKAILPRPRLAASF